MNKKVILIWVLTAITISVNAQTILTLNDTIKHIEDAAISAASVRLLNTNFTSRCNYK